MISDEQFEKAVATLRDGGLVAFPTETVYGLGADATDTTAVAAFSMPKAAPVSTRSSFISQTPDSSLPLPPNRLNWPNLSPGPSGRAR